MYSIDKCEKCAPEDHEGKFCRCEARNIDVAKQMRDKGEFPWKTEYVRFPTDEERQMTRKAVGLIKELVELNHEIGSAFWINAFIAIISQASCQNGMSHEALMENMKQAFSSYKIVWLERGENNG